MQFNDERINGAAAPSIDGGGGRRAAALKILLATLLAATSVLAFAGPAGAHSGDQSYLYLDVTSSAVEGRVELPIKDINDVFELGLGGTDEELLAALAENESTLIAYLQEKVELGSDGTNWNIDYAGAELFYSEVDEIDDQYIVFPFTVDVPTNPVPRELEVRFDPFLDELEGRDNLLLIGNDWQTGVIGNGDEWLAAFNADNRTQTIDLGDPSWSRNLTESVKLGVNHIRNGPDHILFLLAFLLTAVLVFAGRWEPAPTFASAVQRAGKILVSFAVGYTITLLLVGMEFFPLWSPRIVESIIALSIAVVALHNIRPVIPGKEWMMAFAFGLFHGMGFASLVPGLDVESSTQLMTLVGRNIGITIGHVLVVAVLLPALFLLRRTRYYLRIVTVVSILLAIVGIGWTIERSVETDLGLALVVDPIFTFPAAFVGVAVVTVAAYLLMRAEEGAGRLLPVAGTTGETAADDEAVVVAG